MKRLLCDETLRAALNQTELPPELVHLVVQFAIPAPLFLFRNISFRRQLPKALACFDLENEVEEIDLTHVGPICDECSVFKEKSHVQGLSFHATGSIIHHSVAAKEYRPDGDNPIDTVYRGRITTLLPPKHSGIYQIHGEMKLPKRAFRFICYKYNTDYLPEDLELNFNGCCSEPTRFCVGPKRVLCCEEGGYFPSLLDSGWEKCCVQLVVPRSPKLFDPTRFNRELYNAACAVYDNLCMLNDIYTIGLLMEWMVFLEVNDYQQISKDNLTSIIWALGEIMAVALCIEDVACYAHARNYLKLI